MKKHRKCDTAKYRVEADSVGQAKRLLMQRHDLEFKYEYSFPHPERWY